MHLVLVIFPRHRYVISPKTLPQEWDKIWTINKRVIDPVCPRHTAVEEKGK